MPNKPFKSKHATKGEIKKRNHGRVPSSKVSVSRVEHSKQVRKNRASQLRKQSKREHMDLLRRGLVPPRVVTLVPFSASIDTPFIADQLLQHCPQPIVDGIGHKSAMFPDKKNRFTLIPSSADLRDILEKSLLADVILVSVSAHGLTSDALHIANAIKVQGLPTVITIITNLEDFSPSKRQAQKKFLISQINELFGDVRCLTFSDSQSDLANILRFLKEIKLQKITWRANRPYLIAQSVSRPPSTSSLLVSGYIRGAPICVNRLIHLNNFGDFIVNSIKVEDDPLKTHGQNDDVIISRDPTRGDDLQFVRPVDWTAGEQTWPTEEELNDTCQQFSDEEGENFSSSDESSDDECNINVNELDIDAGEEIGQSITSSGQNHDVIDTTDMACDHISDNDDVPDFDFVPRAEDELQFPEEVETSPHTSAQVLFKHFRGLESLRTSPWDPKENLPKNYSRIFGIHDYKVISKMAQRRAQVVDNDDVIASGNYVTIELFNVPSDFEDKFSQFESILSLSGLMKNEGKMTMIHCALILEGEEDEKLLESFNEISVRLGIKKLVIRPVFSEKLSGSDKLKYCKNVYAKRTYVMSFYGPLFYAPMPILLINQSKLIGYGSVISCDPDLIILQKIILTGYPIKIHKATATIRYMFFNREDILFFKPVRLWTRDGLNGNIIAPIGTHGHMKCRFSATLKSSDTVCMSLFKRIYPKFDTKFLVHLNDPINMEADVLEEEYLPYGLVSP
ncbi:hypothetical protein P9112_005676 [Eukaryota sp. TZLM1-RC]